MTRPLRINLPNCLYHIMCRGNRRDPVFTGKEDYLKFLEYLEKYCEIFDFRIHAYCLMHTHIHLLAESMDANLSEFMRRLETAYTVWFHKRHDSRGHLFSGRYKSIVVDKANYLLAVSRYIHLNPVEADIVEKPEDYTWSSLRFYLNPKINLPFLKTSEVLNWFDGNPRDYLAFVCEGLKEDITLEIMKQRFIGGKPFVERMLKRQQKWEQQQEFEQKVEREGQKGVAQAPRKHVKDVDRRHNKSSMNQRAGKDKQGDITVAETLSAACKLVGCTWKEAFARRRRSGNGLLALMATVYFLRENTAISFRDIGEGLGISVVYAQRLYEKASKKEEFKEILSKMQKM